jgi:hypothetical protein
MPTITRFTQRVLYWLGGRTPVRNIALVPAIIVLGIVAFVILKGIVGAIAG